MAKGKWSGLLQEQTAGLSEEGALSVLEQLKLRKQATELLRKEADKKNFVLFLHRLTEGARKEGFAEGFLAAGGFDALLSATASCSGQQGEMLRVVRALLPYQNAIDQFTGNRGMVDRIWGLLRRDTSTKEAKWQKTAKEVLDILLVMIAFIDKGDEMIHETACSVQQGEHPYEVLVPMLRTQDLMLIENGLAFLNLMARNMQQRQKQGDKHALTNLVKQWRVCGLLDALAPLTQQEDQDIRDHLTAFQKFTGHIVPLSEYETEYYKQQMEDKLRKSKDVETQIERFHDSVPRVAVMKTELERVDETLAELQDYIGGLSGDEVKRLQDESKKWAQLQGAPPGTVNEVASYTTKAFKSIACTDVFKGQMMAAVKEEIGREVKGNEWKRMTKNELDDSSTDDELDSSNDSSDDRRKKRVMGKIRDMIDDDDSSVNTPSIPDSWSGDSDVSDPDIEWDDGLDMGDPGPTPGPGPHQPMNVVKTKSGKQLDVQTHGADGKPLSQEEIARAIAEKYADDPEMREKAQAAAKEAIEAGPIPAGGTQQGPTTATDGATHADPGTGAAGTAGAAVVGAPKPGVKPDAKPAAKPTPKPAPGTGKGAGGKKPGGKKGKGKGPPELKPKDGWYTGKKPEKKMKIIHWDKYPLLSTREGEEEFRTLWHQVHNNECCRGELNCEFDYDELETLFSNKVGGTKGPAKEKKKEAIILIDGKKFQNLSIMLHKMPPLEQCDQAVKALDGDVLDQEKLEMLLAGVPTDEEKEEFEGNRKRVYPGYTEPKPEDEYEAAEKFYLMVINGLEFTKRCKAWMFTLEWDEAVVNAKRPIAKLQRAADAVLASKHLPYVMAIVLGFGNLLNYGHAQRGNAGAFNYNALSKLEVTKDVTGKVNLMQHLINSVNARRPEAIMLAEMPPEGELGVCLLEGGAQTVKYDEMEKLVRELEGSLRKFKSQVKQVKDKLDKAGLADTDPFGPKMTAFYEKAEAQFNEVSASHTKVQETFVKVLEYWNAPAKAIKKPEPEDFFGHLVPFLQKFSDGANAILKEKKRLEKLGQQIQGKKGGKGSDAVEQLAAGIKEQLVST